MFVSWIVVLNAFAVIELSTCTLCLSFYYYLLLIFIFCIEIKNFSIPSNQSNSKPTHKLLLHSLISHSTFWKSNEYQIISITFFSSSSPFVIPFQWILYSNNCDSRCTLTFTKTNCTQKKVSHQLRFTCMLPPNITTLNSLYRWFCSSCFFVLNRIKCVEFTEPLFSMLVDLVGTCMNT